MKAIKVGVAALVHDHVWGELKHWKAQPNVELVAAGDVNAALRERIAREFGVERTYPSWQAMLEAEGDALDVVQAAAENSVGAQIVEACAARGLHVVSEKPMAATLAQAQQMETAARDAGTLLLINWPTAWGAAFQEMARRISAGDLGQVRYFKYRSAHNGPKEIGCSPFFYEWLYDAQKNGAGALMDYCGYGAVQCAYFLGSPATVVGIRAILAKDYPVPDDNALLALRYEHAFGVAEASWTQPTDYVAPNTVVYGSEGALSIGRDGMHVLRSGVRGAPEMVSPPPTTAPRRNAPEYLLHCLQTGEPITGICAPDVSRRAQEILEAGLRAADSGQAQTLPLPPLE